jgi:hypothetical protein
MSDEELQPLAQNTEMTPEAAKNESDVCEPPEPVPEGHRPLRSVVTAATVVALGGAIFGLLGLATTPCMGALRSARLRWEERGREIEQASVEQQTSLESMTSTVSRRSNAADE